MRMTKKRKSRKRHWLRRPHLSAKENQAIDRLGSKLKAGSSIAQKQARGLWKWATKKAGEWTHADI